MLQSFYNFSIQAKISILERALKFGLNRYLFVTIILVIVLDVSYNIGIQIIFFVTNCVTIFLFDVIINFNKRKLFPS